MILDSFAGPGGWAEGLRLLRLTEVGLEWDAAACATRVAAGHRMTIRCDVSQYPTAPFAGRVTVKVDSPPCQAYSRAGKGLGLIDQPLVHQAVADLSQGRDTRAQLLTACKDPRSRARHRHRGERGVLRGCGAAPGPTHAGGFVTAPSRWSSRLWQWALTALLVAGVPCAVAWPLSTVRVAGAAVVVTAVVVGLRMLAAERRAARASGDDLTAQEARDLAADLSLQLYRAEDALAFVGECCDIADREGRQPTTAQVREWLRGAQCARQAGLVIDPDTIHRPGGTDA